MTEQKYKKKLIEVALPLNVINEASSKEKSIRHGNISTMHLWWSRKPLAACKAVLFASLVNDPSNTLTEKEAQKERKKLFRLIGELVKWNNPREKEVMKKIKEEIVKSTKGNLPTVLDPFCGGGSIPLAAQMLGLDAYGSDLNPVAVLISKGLVEIPSKFADMPPINPESKKNKLKGEWIGANGIAEDVRYYGKWMRDEAYKKIGHFYPKGPNEEIVVAWLWCRTVKCPNPACQCNAPLANNFNLGKTKTGEYVINPLIENNKINYKVERNPNKKIDGTFKRSGAFCLFCNSPIELEYIRKKGQDKKIGRDLMAIICEGNGQVLFKNPNSNHVDIADSAKPIWKPELDLSTHPQYMGTPRYGLKKFSDLFTNRQLLALETFIELLNNVKKDILSKGGKEEYANSVMTYLAFGVDRCADYWSTIAFWGGSFISHTFGRQAIPMTWAYAEVNPFSKSTGNWMGAIKWITRVLENLNVHKKGEIIQLDATALTNYFKSKYIVSTDPPYYDAVPYGDISDFFYVWLRKSLGKIYPDILSTVLVPKEKEIAINKYRFNENSEKAVKFFELALRKSFENILEIHDFNYPITIYYAYKQQESDEKDESLKFSTGWEVMLSGLIDQQFEIKGTWPIRTERPGRLRENRSNALSASIIIVCRKRKDNAPISTRREFINTLKKELPSALKNLQEAGIAPVDMTQSAIGPGMAVFSRYSKVLEADGTPMIVRTALQIINQELDSYLTEQETDMDKETRFCIAWYEQYGWNEGPFGDANTLATAKGTAVNALDAVGCVYAKAGKVRLLKRTELNENWDPTTDKKITVWECVHYLIKALDERGEIGAAEILRKIGGLAEPVKELAYRLYSLCERKKWTEDGLAYNTLISSWQSITDKAQFAEQVSEETKKEIKDKEQKTFNDL